MNFIDCYKTQLSPAQIVSMFIQEQLVADPFGSVKAAKLLSAFDSWCFARGTPFSGSMRWFGEELGRQGLLSKRSNGIRYIGLRLRD